MRIALLYLPAAVTVVLVARPSHAEWTSIVSCPVAHVVAAGQTAAALCPDEILVVHDDGRVTARLRQGPDDRGANVSRARKQEEEQILDSLEIPELDRASDASDDLVVDESRLAQRRAWHASRPAADDGMAPALAASATQVWIAGPRGLFQVDGQGQIVLRYGRAWTGPRLAAADDRIVVEKEGGLAVLSFSRGGLGLLGSAAHARHFAISHSGKHLAWTTAATIHVLADDAESTLEASTPVVDLAFCGETAVALLANGLVAVPPDGHPEMRNAPADAQRLLCPPGPGAPWFALAQGLWLSSDQGQQWTRMQAPKGRRLRDLAVSDRHVWLATDHGLYMSIDPTRKTDLPDEAPPPRGASRGRLAPWIAWLLPKVSLRGAATLASNGRQIEGFAFAAFPLGNESPAVRGEPSPSPLPNEAKEDRAQDRAQDRADDRDAEADCLPLVRRKAVAQAMAEPERARSYLSRAAHTAWLPELRVLVSRRYGRSESLDVGSSAELSSPLGIDTVNDVRYEARATWDLGKLVFSTDELAAQAQALHMAELRRDIESTINRLYFERRRVLATSSGRSPGQRLRARELEAELDAMSAGAFAACVAEKATGQR